MNEFWNKYTETLPREKLDAVELLPETAYQIPQWLIDEIRSRKEYYKQHPEELIDWDDAQKMIKTD